MRKIIYALGVSLDGYIEDADGSLDWSVPSEELHKHFNDQYLTGEIDTSLYGRRLYENMAAYWPAAHENPDTEPVAAEFARAWLALRKIVFSTSLESVDWNSTLKRDVVREEILELKAQPGGDMDLGGASLAASFLRLGLVDEVRLYVHPVVLGGGKPMFPPNVRLDFELAASRTFDGGVVMLRYVRAG
jgi:dihydrofolate reductase